MAKKGIRHSKAHQTAKYRAMYDKTPQLCKSQVYSELYERMRRDGRLARFIAVIQYCSIKGFDMDDTVEIVCSSFPSYIDKVDFTVNTFKDMLSTYNDIAVAWGYGNIGDEISNIIVRNKALRLVEKTENIEDVIRYQEVFGSKSDEVTKDNNTTVNFILNKPKMK